MIGKTIINLILKKIAGTLAIGFVFSSGVIASNWSEWNLTQHTKEALTLLDVSDSVLGLKHDISLPFVMMQQRREQLTLEKVGIVAGTETLNHEAENMKQETETKIITQEVSKVINEINNYTVSASLTEQELVDLVSKSETLKNMLKGPKGDKGDQGPGTPVLYTLPTSTNTSSMGSIGGFTHLGGNDLVTKNLTVSNNATFTNITVSGCTGCSASWNSIANPAGSLSLVMAANTTTFTYNATTGSNNLFNLTDTNSNTGTGYLLNLTTGSGSSLNPLHVSAAGVEALTILANGNVGIGTTNPTSKLDITISALGITQTTSSGLALVNTTLAAAGAQQISPAIRWSGSGWKTNATAASQTVDFRSYVVPVQGAANPTGYLSFGSSVNGAAYNDGQLVLTSAGNVGIGTTAPITTLTVFGPAATSVVTTDSGTTAALIVRGATNSNRLQFGVGNINAAGNNSWIQSGYDNGGGDNAVKPLSINPSGGNVGIGEAAVGSAGGLGGGINYKLEVNSGQAWNTSHTYARFGCCDGTSRGLILGQIRVDAVADSFAYIQGAYDDDTNLTYPLLINPNGGNVGIGTTNPANSKLEVAGTIAFSDPTGFGGASVCRSASANSNGRYTFGACASSIRFKNNVSDYPKGLQALNELRPVSFNYLNGGKADIGFIAEEVALVEPRLINYDNDGQIIGFEYSHLTALIVKAVQELDTKFTLLSAGQVNSIAGNWSIDGNGDLVIQTITVEKGFNMKDQVSGIYYCVTIKNGEWDKQSGKCSEQGSGVVTGESTPPPAPEPEPEPEITPEPSPTPEPPPAEEPAP